jgi:hypothetical protein
MIKYKTLKKNCCILCCVALLLPVCVPNASSKDPNQEYGIEVDQPDYAHIIPTARYFQAKTDEVTKQINEIDARQTEIKALMNILDQLALVHQEIELLGKQVSHSEFKISFMVVSLAVFVCFCLSSLGFNLPFIH